MKATIKEQPRENRNQVQGLAHSERLDLQGRQMVILASDDEQEHTLAALGPIGASGEEIDAMLRSVLMPTGVMGATSATGRRNWDELAAPLVEQGFVFPLIDQGPTWDRDWDDDAVEAAFEDLPSLPNRSDCDPTDGRDRDIVLLPSVVGDGYALAVLTPPKSHPVLAARAVAESMALADNSGDWEWATFRASLEGKGFVVPEIHRASVKWAGHCTLMVRSDLRGAMAKGA